MARIPIHTITRSDKELLLEPPKQLKRVVVFGRQKRSMRCATPC